MFAAANAQRNDPLLIGADVTERRVARLRCGVARAALIARGPLLPAGEGLAASDSLWAQFRAGKIPATQLIKAAKSFVDNPDSNVATHGGEYFAALRERGFVADAALTDYRRVMNSIYGPKLAELKFDPRARAHSSDTPDAQKLRLSLVDLVAAEGHDTVTRKKLADAAAAYLNGDTNALDQAFYETAFRVRIEDGTLTTTRDLFERVATAKDELFRSNALYALSASRRTEDARWLIGQFKDSRLRSTERLAIMSGLMSETETRDLAFDWLKSNYDEFAKGAGIFAASSIPSLPQDYCSADKAAEIDQLLRPRVIATGRGELPFDRMLEGIRNCGMLKTSKSKELAAALHAAASGA